MNDAALKNFAIWARNKLLTDVGTRAALYRVDADSAQADAIARADGEVLSAQEQRQRADLLLLMRDEGLDALMERAAYTWFNRILAIRFMEVNDRLPSGVRLLSTCEGAFSKRTQAVEEALSLDIEGLDRQQVLDAIQASSDEQLFRVLFLAQCAELSTCMPAVFESIGSAMELLLPDNLLAPDGVIQHLVEDIPEEDWREGVEIVGWMYQYYNAERKDEFFSSKRKASAKDLAPATQLFTPEWIVRYLAQNSLGRLWMLNHPESKLVEQMQYYLSPEEGNCENARKVESPEDITVCDPACGSGHILVYAFDLLATMYDEAGYSRRDIPRLILENNLTGFEIDPRAAQMASFALTMKACEIDSRFLRRAVAPHIVVLHRILLDEDDLARAPHVAARKQLVDTMAHLNECGSLFVPSEDDIRALEDDLATLSGERLDMFANATLEKLDDMQQLSDELSRTFDAVIANPPYMGSSNMSSWLAKWTAKHHPDAKRDLCTCFLERGFTLAIKAGYSAMVTSSTCMFLSSFEKMRAKILAGSTIVSLIDTSGSNNHPDVFDANAGWIIRNARGAHVTGAYLKLNQRIGEKEAALREAVANPSCGWFYRRSAKDFKSIPGTPIAYWASEAVRRAFAEGDCLSDGAKMPYGFKTGDNDRFLRVWWEVCISTECFCATDDQWAACSPYKWFPYNKGGYFRRWYGNNDYVLNYGQSGEEVLHDAKKEGRNAADYSHQLFFRPTLTWSRISSGKLAVRHSSKGAINDMTGPGIYASDQELIYLQAFLNSSVAACIAELVSPTLDFQPGQVGSYPILSPGERDYGVSGLVLGQRSISKEDWDSFETSWDFTRHPLI